MRPGSITDQCSMWHRRHTLSMLQQRQKSWTIKSHRELKDTWWGRPSDRGGRNAGSHTRSVTGALWLPSDEDICTGHSRSLSLALSSVMLTATLFWVLSAPSSAGGSPASSRFDPAGAAIDMPRGFVWASSQAGQCMHCTGLEVAQIWLHQAL